ncbi:MAG: hypothetical protein MI920_06025 [Kiloniellales bacterium]|nr:hypothetical protein [Kiloniellales bacterium]
MQRALDLVALDEAVREAGEGMRADVIDRVELLADTAERDLPVADLDQARHVVLDVSGLGGEMPAVARPGVHANSLQSLSLQLEG